MTLEQLRIFVAVAERSHITRAAKDLGMTQSAVSAAVAALENRYGASLFDRIGRGIELSRTGRRFLPEARAVLERAAEARAALEEASSLTAGSIAIAASQTIASYWLPSRLTAFQTRYPGIRLDVTIGNTAQVEDSVGEGAADIGFVEGPTRHRRLLRERVDEDRMVLVVSAATAMPDTSDPAGFDLRALPWVLREAGSGTRAAFEALATDRGIAMEDLNIALVLPGNEAVREAVEAGAGATIISEHVVARDIRAGLLRAVPIDLHRREFAVLRDPGRAPSAAQTALRSMLVSQAMPEALQ